MRRFGAEQEIGIEVDRCVGAAGAIHADRNSGAGSLFQVAVHPKRDGDIGVARQEHTPHRHRLQRLLGNLSQHRRGVETNLRAFGRSSDAPPGVPS